MCAIRKMHTCPTNVSVLAYLCICSIPEALENHWYYCIANIMRILMVLFRFITTYARLLLLSHFIYRMWYCAKLNYLIHQMEILNDHLKSCAYLTITACHVKTLIPSHSGIELVFARYLLHDNQQLLLMVYEVFQFCIIPNMVNIP